jgi:hypothetical protein
MSSYGTASLMDVTSADDLAAIEGFIESRGAHAFSPPSPSGWIRRTAYFEEPGILDDLMLVARNLEKARIVLAEDFDEYGALWAVLAVDSGAVRTVHRRYVLNADPDDEDSIAEAISELETDPRTEDIAGDEAAAAVALLFDVDPAAVVTAERESDSAWESIGIIGGPFPWWDALELPWPED